MTKPNDLSQGWLPVTVVASLLLSVGAAFWWGATEHAAIEKAQATAQEAGKAAAAAEARAAAAEARAAAAEVSATAKTGDVLAKLAGIETGVASLRIQNNNIEVQLAELRAALLRGGR